MAKLATLTDDFNDNSLDTSKWTVWGTNASANETGGMLQVTTTTTAGYAGFTSLNTFDLSESEAVTQLISAGNTSLTSYQVFPISITNNGTTNKIEWVINSGSIHAEITVSGGTTTVRSAAFSSTIHKWFKIRETNGRIFWDYSTNGCDWTNFASTSTVIPITELYVAILAGTWSNMASSTTAQFDNFNVSVSSPTYTFTTTQSADDAMQNSSGTVTITEDGTTTAGNINGSNHAGFRFPNITIDNSTPIVKARLRFPKLNNYTGTGTIPAAGGLYGQAIDNAPVFTTAANNISSRSKTTTRIDSKYLPATSQWEGEGIDVTNIVREILERPGWASGNALALIFNGFESAGNYIRPYHWDYFSGMYAAQLIIETQESSTASQLPTSHTIVSDGNNTWSNPTNAYFDDGQVTTSGSVTGGVSHTLKLTGFNFNIPQNAHIDGILVRIKKRGSGITPPADAKMQLLSGGSEVGASYDTWSETWTTTSTWYTYGGALDTWGRKWTPAEINASNFGIAIQAAWTGSTSGAEIDNVQIKVLYSNENNGLYEVEQAYLNTENDYAQWGGNPAGFGNFGVIHKITNNTGDDINLARMTWRMRAGYATNIGGDPKGGGGGYTINRAGNWFNVRPYSSLANAENQSSAVGAQVNLSLKDEYTDNYDAFWDTPVNWPAGSSLYFRFNFSTIADAGAHPPQAYFTGTQVENDDAANQTVYSLSSSPTVAGATTSSIFYVAYSEVPPIPGESAFPEGDSSMEVSGYKVTFEDAIVDIEGDSESDASGLKLTSDSVEMVGDSKLISDYIVFEGGSDVKVDGTVNVLTIQKSYIYKIYDQDWNYLGLWNDVVSEFSYSQEINSAGSSINVVLARNSDSLVGAYDVLADDNNDPIITDDGQEIAAETTTLNAIGPGTTVDLNLNVRIYEFSSEVENLEGDVVFTGYISRYVSRYGSTENTEVTLFSYGADMDNWVLEDTLGNTRVPFYSRDPGDILAQSLRLYNNAGGISTFTGNNTGRAVTFNGTSDWIKLPTSVSTAMNGETTFSFGGWIRKDGPATAQEMVMSVNTAADGNTFLFGFRGAGSVLSFYDASAWEITGTTDVTDGNWHSFVYIRNGSTGTLYVDNVSQGSHTANFALTSTDKWQLGAEWDPGVVNDWLNADLDDVFITNTVLDSAQRTAFHTDGTIPSSGLVAKYTFDLDVGKVVLDSSGNDRHAEAQGDGIEYTTETRTPYTGTNNSVEMVQDYIEDYKVSYTFNVNTMFEVLKKCLELAPSDWYFYVDLATNLVHFHPKPTEPDHYFYLGKHILKLDLEKYIEDITNTVYFSGGKIGEDSNGNDINLFKKYEDPASILAYRRGLQRIQDSRVRLETSADIMSQTEINRGKEPRYRTSITISNGTYPIKTIKLGQLIGFRNFGNFVDDITMQVVRIDYSPDEITLQLDTLLPTVPKRLEDIKRNLQQAEITNNPDAPAIV